MTEKVLVLHQSDELKVIALQKDLCLKYGNQKGVFKKYPLWIKLPSDFSVKDVCSVATGNFFSDENGFYISVSIKLENGTEIKSALQLLEFSKGSGGLKCSGENIQDFSLQPRIFRSATANFEENRYWLTDSIWKKIKK